MELELGFLDCLAVLVVAELSYDGFRYERPCVGCICFHLLIFQDVTLHVPARRQYVGAHPYCFLHQLRCRRRCQYLHHSLFIFMFLHKSDDISILWPASILDLLYDLFVEFASLWLFLNLHDVKYPIEALRFGPLI